MAKINVTLQQARISDFQARINIEKEKTPLQVSVSIQAKKPIDSDDLSGLLRFQIVVSADNKEEFYLSVTEELVFEFDKLPSDFDEIIKEKCIPAAAQKVSESIDGILELMGNAPLKLNLNRVQKPE